MLVLCRIQSNFLFINSLFLILEQGMEIPAELKNNLKEQLKE